MLQKDGTSDGAAVCAQAKRTGEHPGEGGCFPAGSSPCPRFRALSVPNAPLWSKAINDGPTD